MPATTGVQVRQHDPDPESCPPKNSGPYDEAMDEVDTSGLGPVERLIFDNALANSRLEGGDIPDELQQLSVSFLAGEIDSDTFRAQARAFTARLYKPADD